MTKIIKQVNIVNSTFSFGLDAVLSPSAITGNTNNYNPTGLENVTILRLTTTGNFNLTGLVPPDITISNMILVYNLSVNSITLKDNSASSTASNRFILGADKNLQTDEGIALVYDTISQRWRSFGINI